MKIEIVNEPFPMIGSGNLERSEGVHLSDVIRYIQRSLGRSKDGSGWDQEPTWGVGLLWEVLLSLAFGSDCGERVGEIIKDDIIMTPDGFNFDKWIIEEHKATWRSSNREITDPSFWDWFTQIKSYCYAMGTDKAILRVLYINGGYRHTGPEYKRYDFTFKPHELEENWEMIVAHRDKMIKEEG